MSKILVIGGAGYIGSHTVKALLDAGHDVSIFDNLSLGHVEAAETLGLTVENQKLFVGDILNSGEINDALAQGFDAVIHFAARSLVGESVSDPLMYYENNISGTVNLLEAMKNNDVTSLVFSSTAATYGNPDSAFTRDRKIPESHPLNPINPYGRTKLAIEWALEDSASAWGLKSTALRYFNAAGNDANGVLGELHIPESHLIPIVFGAYYGRTKPNGEGMNLTVFGDDYDTPDGTCIRDYIHVEDLAAAHVVAAEENIALNVGKFDVYNVGTGKGYSVLEVIKGIEAVIGKEIPFTMGERRAGDPDVLVADSSKLVEHFGWQPKYTSIEEIVKSVHVWTEAIMKNNWKWPVLHRSLRKNGF